MKMGDMAALVTGGTGGLGAAIARELATAGVAVAVAGRDRTRLQEQAEQLRKTADVPCAGLELDLLKDGDAARVVNEAVAQLGHLEILVNCAGAPADGRLSDLSLADWQRSFNVKVFGAFELARAALPHLARSGAGTIVTLSGMRAHTPAPGAIIPGAMNAALENGMTALALEVASQGIRVLTVSPGPFMTARLGTIFERVAADSGMTAADVQSRQAGKVPIGRFGDPAEIGRLVRFLVSDEAGYLTGSVVTIDGGAAGARM